MLEKSPKDSEMSDAAIARGIIDGLWPIKIHGRSNVIVRAYDALKRVERSFDPEVRRQRQREWTERRVRSIVDREIRRVDAYEISDLELMAMREARNEYRQSIQRAARMATFLQTVDESFHEPEIDRLREFMRSVDRT